MRNMSLKENDIYSEQRNERLQEVIKCPNCHIRILPEENQETGEFWCSECGYEL